MRRQASTISLEEELQLEARILSARRLGAKPGTVRRLCPLCHDVYFVASGHRGSVYCKMVATRKALLERQLAAVSMNYKKWMDELGVPYELHETSYSRVERGAFKGIGELETRMWVPMTVAKAVRLVEETGRTEFGPTYSLCSIETRRALIADLVLKNKAQWLREGIGTQGLLTASTDTSPA